MTETESTGYFRDPRPDVLMHLSGDLGDVLEVGCAEGEFGKALLERRLATSVVGIDAYVPTDAAREQLTDFIRADVCEWLSGNQRKFDSVLALDVLEHLEDPWTTTRSIAEHLTEGGVLVASIPNVRYVGVTLPLTFAGRFDYRKSGILDRTHLRFFTRRSILELVRQAGLEVEAVHRLRHPNQRLSRRLLALLLGDHGTKQFLVLARRPQVSCWQ